MSGTNLVRKATPSTGGLAHARYTAYEAARSRLSEVDMPGPSRRSIRHPRQDLPESHSSRLHPNQMTATSVAHYYKPTDDYENFRRKFGIHPNRALHEVSTETPSSPVPDVDLGRGAADATSYVVKFAGPHHAGSADDSRLKRGQRKVTLKRFTSLIKAYYGQQYDVRPFGSTCYGASNNASDIDVVIIDAERPYGIPPYDHTPLPVIYDVRQLANVLRKEGYDDVSYISNATVPIVKFMDPVTKMSCDANVNNRLGLYNTALLRQYCLRMPSLAGYLRTLKHWVKSVDLNNPAVAGKPRSFSSYAITLMTIAYLQSTGYLPNLQADQEAILKTHFWEHRLGMRRSVPISFGACKDWQPRPWLDLPLKGWFRFWAEEFDFKTQVVSVRDGGFIQRPDRIPRLWGHHWQGGTRDAGNIVVLDPLSRKNCTYQIQSETLERFKLECATQLSRL